METNSHKFTFIDLFCGIGGFHQAMSSLGGKCVFASDIDQYCREAYMVNYNLMPHGDITTIDVNDIPPHDVLCAGFPCQAFSKAGKRLGFADQTKGTLFFDICRILKHHRPKYALLENVRNLATHDNGNTWKVIYTTLRELGYNLLENPIIFSPHLIGIPQHRERVYIMCVREDIGDIEPFLFMSSFSSQCSIESILEDDDKIPDLHKYRLPDDMIKLIDLWNEFIQNIKVPRLPGFPVWSEFLRPINPDETSDDIPAWKKTFIMRNNELYNSNKEFINSWLKKANENPLFFGAKAKLEWQAGQITHPDIWKQIFQFRPSGIRVKVNTYYPALVAIVQTSIIGPRKRYLTPRECARLQSFPESFIPHPNTAQAYKQFGNSVNVEVLKRFARYMFGDVTAFD